MIRKTKRTPLYSQIRDYVLANIQQQRWRVNDQLPTEAELADKFQVSRFTVKKALGELVEEGLIYRIQGKGSFIATTVIEQQESPLHETNTPYDTLKPIVYLTPHIPSSLSANILTGAEEYVSEHGYQLIVRSSGNEQDTECQVLMDSVRAGVRGVLIFPVDGESYNEDLLRLTLNKFPVVVIDRYLKGVETNCVCSDHVGGAFDAASHLIGLGHNRIAFIAVHGSPTTSLEERLSGYERALTEHQLPIGPCLHHYTAHEELRPAETSPEQTDDLARTAAIVRTFLERHPSVTAVFAANSHSGLATMKAAEDLGRKVPEQLSVVCFDDVEHASLLRIPPTCVVQQEKELGMEAAKLLLSVIDNPLQERRKVTLPTRLVLRQSTAHMS